MTLCTPPCLHQDYCAYYGCPFEREPQSSNSNPGGACLENAQQRCIDFDLNHRRRLRPDQSSRHLLSLIAKWCDSRERTATEFQSDASTSRPEAVAKSAAYLFTPVTAMALAKSVANSAIDGRVQNRISVFTRPPNLQCPTACPLMGSTRKLLKNERGNCGIAALEFSSRGSPSVDRQHLGLQRDSVARSGHSTPSVEEKDVGFSDGPSELRETIWSAA